MARIIDLSKTNSPIESHDPEEISRHFNELKKTKKVVTTSGFFDPIHHGHVELFQLSKKLGDYLIVLVNNDLQTKLKKGYVFMPHEEKAKIIAEFGCVDEVFITLDTGDTSQCKTLAFIKPHIFAKGGDRYTYEIPETPTCREHGIQIIDGVGAKVQSSSELVENANKLREELSS